MIPSEIKFLDLERATEQAGASNLMVEKHLHAFKSQTLIVLSPDPSISPDPGTILLLSDVTAAELTLEEWPFNVVSGLPGLRSHFLIVLRTKELADGTLLSYCY